MYKGKKVFDVHGHISTPPHFRAAAMNLIALRINPARRVLRASEAVAQSEHQLAQLPTREAQAATRRQVLAQGRHRPDSTDVAEDRRRLIKLRPHHLPGDSRRNQRATRARQIGQASRAVAGEAA